MLYNKLEDCRKRPNKQRIMCLRGAESTERVPTSLQVSAMARNLSNSQSVCIPLFSYQHYLAALTRQTIHARCNTSLYLLQNCCLLKCKNTNHTLCSRGSTIESSVHLHYCFPASAREILRHVLLFCEWLKIYFFFTSIIFACSSSFDFWQNWP